MRAVRLVCLALVAEAHAAVRRLDGEGGVLDADALLLLGQVAVAIFVVERRPGVGEDGGGVAPVEQAVENEAEGRCEVACSAVSVLHACLDGVRKAHQSSHSWTAPGRCQPRPRRPRKSGHKQTAAESRLLCCSSIARPFLPTPGGACGQGTTCSGSTVQPSGSGSSSGRRDWITEGGCCSAPFACRQQAQAGQQAAQALRWQMQWCTDGAAGYASQGARLWPTVSLGQSEQPDRFRVGRVFHAGSICLLASKAEEAPSGPQTQSQRRTRPAASASTAAPPSACYSGFRSHAAASVEGLTARGCGSTATEHAASDAGAGTGCLESTAVSKRRSRSQQLAKSEVPWAALQLDLRCAAKRGKRT